MDKVRATLKLIAPVNSIYSADVMVRAGADEFYLGMESRGLEKITLTTREKRLYSGKKTYVTEEGFADIVKIAHDNNIKVNLVANIPFIPYATKDEQNGQHSNIVTLYLEMINCAKEKGTDAVIIGGINPLLEIKKAGINLPIHAGSLNRVLNSGQVELLKELGVSRIIYPYHITLGDIKNTSHVEEVEYEVFGHFSCAGVSGLCFLRHVNDEELNIQRPCRNTYQANSSFCNEQNYTFLDANLDCSICSLDKLIALNIHGIKIVGRERAINITAPIVKQYRTCIDMLSEGVSRGEVKHLVSKNPFWVKYFCSQHRCKYLFEENLKAMI